MFERPIDIDVGRDPGTIGKGTRELMDRLSVLAHRPDHVRHTTTRGSDMTIRARGSTRRALGVIAALALVAAAGGAADDSASSATTAPSTAASSAATSASSAPTGADSTATTASTDESTATSSASEGTDLPQVADADLDLNATLDVTTDGPPTLLDPHQEPTQGVTPYWTPLYDSLTDINIAGEVRPRLATSWEYSDDGLSLVLELRDDVKFHDGTPLDAAAVKASLDRARTLEKSTMKN